MDTCRLSWRLAVQTEVWLGVVVVEPQAGQDAESSFLRPHTTVPKRVARQIVPKDGEPVIEVRPE